MQEIPPDLPADPNSIAGLVQKFNPKEAVPAVSVLQDRAAEMGGNGAEITSSSYSTQSSHRGAKSIETITGNVYRCRYAAPPAVAVAPPQVASPAPARVLSPGAWRPWTMPTSPDGLGGSGILLVADDGRSNLSFVCLSTRTGRRLSAALTVGKPVQKMTYFCSRRS